jgi:16S rRNA (adenine1518-N6/adenine1519-N6)-dimethyltransferase
VQDAEVAPGDRIVEIGAGFGSLTVALAAAGCRVLALETDRRLVLALREVVATSPDVRVEQVDAMRADWAALLDPPEGWATVSNLPYNISIPLVLDLLEHVSAIARYLVMVQREVGERLVAKAGDDAYGAVSVRVAYRADAALVRRVPAEVFWPRPKIDSALVRIAPHPPSVDTDPAALFRVVDEGFAERRKTMANALRRLGLDVEASADVMREAGLDARARAERLGLEDLARITRSLLAKGWSP